MDAPFRIETARLFGVAPMDKLFEQAPKIIEEAAKSPLGLLALMIMALSILALFFFRKASPRIRVGIFLVVFVGFLLLGVALYRVILPGRDRGSESPRPQPNGKVVKLQRLPTIPVDVDHLGDWVVAWLKEFYNAQIIIDKGSLQGTKEGDYFFVIEEENEIKSNEGQSLGLLQERGSLVEVVEVHPKFSTCKLSQFAYESHFKGLEAKVEKAADKDGNIDSEKIAGLFAPITVGQKVIAVPREEKALWDESRRPTIKRLQTALKMRKRKSAIKI
jgi:hypothetical protein